MKTLFAAAIGLAVCFAAHGALAGGAADAVSGIWLVQSNDGKFDIRPCGDSMCGKLVWQAKPKLDAKNKNPALRSRPLVGLVMLKDFHLSQDGARWVDGLTYNPRDGNFYKSSLEPGPNDTLKMKACLGPFCQTQTWTRAAP